MVCGFRITGLRFTIAMRSATADIRSPFSDCWPYRAIYCRRLISCQLVIILMPGDFFPNYLTFP